MIIAVLQLREDGMNNNVLQLNRENVLGGIYVIDIAWQ